MRREFDTSAANGNRSQRSKTTGGAAETTLDPVGNRLTEGIVATSGTPTSSKTLTYDTRDRLTSLDDSVDPTQDATFTWDENGNQIAKSQGGVVEGFLYDALDRLVEVQRDGLLLERYSFDPAGYRIRKAGPDGIFRYVRDDGAILQQTDDAGTTLARYEWGADRLVAMQHATEGRSFSLFDGLGSLTAWSQSDGALSLRRSFDAWGNVRRSTGSTLAPFAFTGHELDEATGLTYAKARFLDTELGRFLSEDPYGGNTATPPSLHRYLYAYGNPTAYTDPLGLYSWNQFKRDVAFVTDVYVETQKGMWDPRNAGKNAQRAVGGAIGVGKFVGETVVGLGSLAVDTMPGVSMLPGAQQRNTERVKALAEFAAHPVDTVVSAHQQAITRIEEHEAKGEYIQSGMVGGELGAADAAAVVGGAEAGAALARGASRLASRALTLDFTGVEAGFTEGLGGLPKPPPAVSRPVGVGSGVLAEGEGLLIEEVPGQVTRGVPAEGRLSASPTPSPTSPLLEKYLSGSGGRWGGSATRAQNHALASAEEGQGFTISGGGGRAAEEWIPGPGGGTKGGSFVDVTASSGSSTVRIQTVSTLADGVTLTPSEAAAAARIRAAFPDDELRLVPKNRQPR